MVLKLTEAPKWAEKITTGTVAMYRFPVNSPQPGETAKARPCVVVAVRVENGQQVADLAYASSVFHGRARGLEIRVSTEEGLAAAGLHKPTRIEIERRITVPLDDPEFVFSQREGTPVIGRLSAADLLALKRQEGRRKAALRRAA